MSAWAWERLKVSGIYGSFSKSSRMRSNVFVVLQFGNGGMKRMRALHFSNMRRSFGFKVSSE